MADTNKKLQLITPSHRSSLSNMDRVEAQCAKELHEDNLNLAIINLKMSIDDMMYQCGSDIFNKVKIGNFAQFIKTRNSEDTPSMSTDVYLLED